MWSQVGLRKHHTNKATGGDGIPAELFQSWKMMLWKCCTQYASKFGKLISGHSTGKGQFSFQSQKEAMPKNVQTTAQLHLSHTPQNSPSQASTVHEPWTSKCSSWVYKRQRNQRSNCEHLLDHRKSKRVPEKHLLLLIDYAKAFDCVDHEHLGKFFKGWKYQTTWPASWEVCMQVRKQQLELDMGQQIGSKSGKEYVKAVYCHPAYLTYR